MSSPGHLDSIKECLWYRQPSALLGAEPSQRPTNLPRLDPQAEFNTQNHANYAWLMANKWDSSEEALAMAREPTNGHWWLQHCWKKGLRG